jgi:orotate phosphoribosyltransferase-like protein
MNRGISKEALIELKNKGFNQQQMAEYLNVERSTISYLLLKNGLRLPQKKRNPEEVEEIMNKAFELYSQGVSRKEIAETIGISTNYVNNLINRNLVYKASNEETAETIKKTIKSVEKINYFKFPLVEIEGKKYRDVTEVFTNN